MKKRVFKQSLRTFSRIISDPKANTKWGIIWMAITSFIAWFVGPQRAILSGMLADTFAKELSRKEGISVNQFVMLAVAEKIAVISAIEYLDKRARRGSREKLIAVLNKVPDVEPEAYDRL